MSRQRKVLSEESSKKWHDEREMLLYTREFLNKPGIGSTASIICKAEKITGFLGDKFNEQYINTELNISDCSTRISLDVGVSKDRFDNTIYKLNKLITSLTEFKEVLLKTVPTIKKKDDE
jgi:hypothetical protein